MFYWVRDCSLFSQPGINTYGVCWKNVPRHARVLFAHFDAASKSPVFPNVTVPRFSSTALYAATCFIRLRWLLFCVRKCCVKRQFFTRVVLSRLGSSGRLGSSFRLSSSFRLRGAANCFFKNVNSACGSASSDVHRTFCSLSSDIHGGFNGVRCSVT